MMMVILRNPVNRRHQSEQQLRQRVLYLLTFPDIAVSISQLL
jgi:hypothetical protein